MAELGFTVIDDGRAVEVASAEGVARAGRAQGAGRPVAIDPDERAAYLGVAASVRARARVARGAGLHAARPRRAPSHAREPPREEGAPGGVRVLVRVQIGRASCRERV